MNPFHTLKYTRKGIRIPVSKSFFYLTFLCCQRILRNPAVSWQNCFKQHNFSFLQIEVFWVVTVCIVSVGYCHFGGPCCFHLHGITTQKTLTWSSPPWKQQPHLSYFYFTL